MSRFFRSIGMKYYNLMIPRESAWDVMNELGGLECIHFVDYDPELPMINRPFANYIKRCEESLNKLIQIEGEMVKQHKKLTKCTDIQGLMSHYKSILRKRDKASHTYFEEIEQQIEKKSIFIHEQVTYFEGLQEKLNSLVENKAVLIKCNKIFGQAFFQEKTFQTGLDMDIRNKDMEDIRGLGLSVKFNQMIGVIDREDEQRFKKMVFRLTKGNALLKVLEIDENQGRRQLIDPKNMTQLSKSVYIIVFPGSDYGGSSSLKSKLTRMCESFGKGRYEFPNSQGEVEKRLAEIDQLIEETTNLIRMTSKQIGDSLEEFQQTRDINCSYLEQLKLYVIREKYLYVNLNYLRMQGSIFCGHFWLPDGEDRNIEEALRNIRSQGDQMPIGQIQQSSTKAVPPTYFKVNEFTWTFQEIVNTYGVPRFREVNPGLFTIITFPFLFGVMFGDIGHGLLLFCLGMYLIIYNQKIMQGDSSFKTLVPARHLIALMGFFAFYNGFIYNDYVSLSLNLFGSCYETVSNKDGDIIWQLKDTECVYPFGIDPAWAKSKNQLTFVNSYKMKLAVIIGVIHMTFGIILKAVNSVHFRNSIDLIFEFVPQLLFMICTFGFMDFMIIYKWTHVYPPMSPTDSTPNAPSIITIMIGMVLAPTSDPDPSLWDPQNEKMVSLVLLVIAVLCVPIMLFVKPFLLKSQHSRKVQIFSQFSQTSLDHPSKKPLLSQEVDSQILDSRKSHEIEEQFGRDLARVASIPNPNHHKQDDHHDEFDFAEIFVHQIIETIEFVLGSISNTASYLRLWALSLAHGQLAEVFFNMTLKSFIDSGGASGSIGLCLAFSLFALATFGVLMIMDVMECFLHALRLHWVEFQNKFYKADGYLFVPFSYQQLLKNSSNTENE